MYETYAPKPQGKFAGAVAAVALTASAGAALVFGMATDIIPTRIVKTEIVTLPPEDEEIALIEPVAVEIMSDVTPLETLITTELPSLPDFEVEPAILATPAVAPPGVGFAAVGPTSSPSLRGRSIPPYPPASVRAGEQGVSTIEVCVSASGQVTSAQLVESSGHPRLDEAALNWLKTARFNPAKSNGRTTAVCGYQVAYEWNIKNAT